MHVAVNPSQEAARGEASSAGCTRAAGPRGRQPALLGGTCQGFARTACQPRNPRLHRLTFSDPIEALKPSPVSRLQVRHRHGQLGPRALQALPQWLPAGLQCRGRLPAHDAPHVAAAAGVHPPQLVLRDAAPACAGGPCSNDLDATQNCKSRSTEDR